MNGNTKYKYNEDIFKEIRTPEEAYLFGYLWADGHLTKYTITACAKLGDEYTLKMCKKYIGGRFYVRERFDKRFKVKHFKINEFIAGNKIIVNNLLAIEFRKKSTHVPLSLRRYFVRGYLDGNGCVYVNKKHYLFQLSFASGQIDWSWLTESLPSNLRNEYSLTNNGKHIRWCGKKAKNILAWIYFDKPTLGLARKRKIYVTNKE